MPSFRWEPLSILPLNYQSQNVERTDWITLLTLCLAPLIAHIVAGAPSPSYLSNTRPKWHDSICHYNPTSILWRYAAIADRRIRAKAWDRYDLAATNAIFWTEQGWNGTEALIESSRPYCVHPPEHTWVSIFSREMLKTVIVTAQGVQTIILLSAAFDSQRHDAFTQWLAVDTVFFPLALIGLLRIVCGFWMNDDFSYSEPKTIDTSPNKTSSSVSRFHSTSFWPSRLFLAVYLLAVLGLLVLDGLFLISGGRYTTTSFVVTLFYLLFLSGTAVIFLCYFVTGHTVSTIIPCISTTAYKVYTGVVFGFAAAAVVISCIETRKTPCGKFTSGPGETADIRACWTPTTEIISLQVGFEYGTDQLSAYNFSRANDHEFVKMDPDEWGSIDFDGVCFRKAEGL
ncbi:hypothetical protein F66182_9398 [Fusarium sp. NRRL 66182]|nr:hypothetical protein F66182_9398 [Fusarium sp. NRRL 66182]